MGEAKRLGGETVGLQYPVWLLRNFDSNVKTRAVQWTNDLYIEYVASYQRLINTLLWGLPSWEFAGRTPEQWKLAEGGPPLLVYIIRIYIYYIYTQCMYRLYNEMRGYRIYTTEGRSPRTCIFDDPNPNPNPNIVCGDITKTPH